MLQKKQILSLKGDSLVRTCWGGGWMDDLRFYVLFNSISVISGRWEVDNERLCGKELRLRLRRFRLERESNSVRKIRRPALNPLSHRGSLGGGMEMTVAISDNVLIHLQLCWWNRHSTDFDRSYLSLHC